MKARRIAAIAASLGLLSAGQPTRAAVTEMEYFLGSDPGEGSGTKLEVISGSNSIVAELPRVELPSNLSPGTHRIGVRVKDSAGRWSNPLYRRLTIHPADFSVPPPSSAPTTNSLVAAEYFVGNDPGAGRATILGLAEVGLTASANAVNPLVVDAGPGSFTVGLRFRDSAGRWGNPVLRRVTVQPGAAVADTLSNLPTGNAIPPEPAARQIHRIDLAGAFRCGQTFSVTIGGKTLEVPARPFETAANFLQRLAQAINSDPVMASMVQAATDGANSLLLTARIDGWQSSDWVGTSAGLRSSLVSYGSLGSEGRKIVAAEYFVGLTPAPGSGTPMMLNTTNGNTSDFSETALPITAYRGGTHSVGVRFKNAAGFWGQPVIRGFTSYVLFGSQDTNSPAITLNGDAILSIPYASVFSDPGATATDDVDGDLTSKLVVRGQVDTAIPGDYELQYWCEDTAGNRSVSRRIVRVTDTTQPVFQGAQDVVHTTPPATVDLFAGLRAVDAQFGDLSYRVKLVTNNVNWFAPGTYSAQFEVKDPAGNTAVLNRNITLGENAVFYPGFQTWMSARAALAGANEGQMQAQADPDADGRSNLQEWQADTDPFNRWSLLAAEFTPTASGFRMSWSALQRIVYTMENSTNMTTWLPLGDPVTYGSSCILDAEIPRNPSDRRMFYRVRAAPKQPLLEVPPQ